MSSSALRRSRVLLLALAAATPLGFFHTSPAALGAGGYWKLQTRSAPSVLPLAGEQLHGAGDEHINGEAMLVVSATNLGDANIDGETAPVTLSDHVPAGLEVVSAKCLTGRGVPGQHGSPEELPCETSSDTVAWSFSGQLPPFVQLELQIVVKSTTTVASEPVGEVTVSGGGLSPDSLAQRVRIAPEPAGFGVEAFELTPEEEDGTLDTRSGSHPFQLTSLFDLDEAFGFDPEAGRVFPEAPALERELQFRLPPGLVGDVAAVPQCPDVDFGAQDEEDINSCPDDSAVGVAMVTFNDPILFGYQTWPVPVFNLPPAPGEPARFGLSVIHVPVILDTSVRSGEDYGVNVTVHDSSQAVQILGAQVTLWGTPGEPAHDSSRGWNCLGDGFWVEGYKPGTHPCTSGESPHPTAFLTLPSTCSSLGASVTGTAWSGQTLAAQATNAPQLEGCGGLAFEPSIAVSPDTNTASTPTGLTVEVGMPQSGTLAPEGLAEADIEHTTLVLPEGLQLNPGAANGLGACSAGEVGFNLRTNGGFQEGLAEAAQLENDDFSPAVGEPPCPPASKIGSVEIQTPLLGEALKGAVYLAAQDTDPFRSPLVLYLIAQEPTSKVAVKLAGEVTIDEQTGQLTSTFENTPPLPFEHLKLTLSAGHPAQSTPAFCGGYQATASFTPWSGNGPATVASNPGEFQIATGPGGGPCPSRPLPFAPAMSAGSTSSQAAAFTSFQLALERPDGQQPLNGVEVHLPPGVAALLSSVTPCPEPAPGVEWACGEDSLLGHSSAQSGLGNEPVVLGGDVYLTTGYDGAPFGLLVRTHAAAGPFDLGYVNVRSRINVNPETAAVTVTTDPGPRDEALITRLKGVPVQLKRLLVTVDRPGFEFNPTSCQPMAIAGTISGAEGASTGVSSPFQVEGCDSLPFHPSLEASTQGQASKADGASLDVKVTSQGLGVANIKKVFLTIPKILPSRLQPTLQHACPDSVFNANPAACDEDSLIGSATVHTPVLKSPLTGPAYVVSHGNAAFPDVEFVLQGEGITLVLDGKTDIKNGVTYSRFEAAPDAPFTSFETVLPAGPHSILAVNTEEAPNYDLCTHNITIPTVITAQDGAVLEQTTKVALSGCPAAKPHTTTAQLLAKALKACHTKYEHNKKKRLACEKTARRKYSSTSAKKPAHEAERHKASRTSRRSS